MNIQTHLSIDTADLRASGAFYRALLGCEPALARPDYMRFDVREPAVALGLNAVPGTATLAAAALRHVGLRYPDEGGLARARERLAGAGIALELEPDTVCCYARLTRAWATDPSGVLWELFYDPEPVVEAASAGNGSACCAPGCCP